jgi:NDP-sugar pyrophosphorylase family protein
MKAFILAAGLGTRLRSLGLDVPKVMVPIGGKPLLEHHLELFRRQGIREIIINLHYLPETITTYFGDGSQFRRQDHLFARARIAGHGGRGEEDGNGIAGRDVHRVLRGQFGRT